ncbi:hypothetical protein ACSSVY_001325 [Roseovarius sp. MBR-51]
MMSLFLARLTRSVLLTLALIICIPSFASAESGPGGRDFVTGLLKESDFTPIFRAMSQYFPEDARNLEVSLRRTADRLGVDRTDIIPIDDVTRMSQDIANSIAQFYANYRTHVYNAPNIALLNVLQAHIQPIKYLQAHGNDCNNYLVYGASSSLIQTEVPYSMIEVAAVTKFQAMYDGSMSPVPRPQLTAYSDALRNQVFRGMDQEEIELLSSPQITNPKTCSANIKLLENIWRAEGHDAELYRAETVLLLLSQ